MSKLIEEIDEILDPLRAWILNFRDERGRYRYFRDSEQKYCLYATLEGLSVANMLGVEAGASPARTSALSFMQDCQSAEDGYFRCPVCTAASHGYTCNESNKDGVTFKAAATLLMAGAAPRYPLPDGEVFPGDVGQALENVFLKENPYSAGSIVWKKAGMRGLKVLSEGQDPMQDGYMSRIIAWLMEHQDKATGFWFPKGDSFNGMNGLLKMRYGTFDLCGKEIPNPAKIVTSILPLQSPENGRFGPSCGDWNAVGLLAEIGRRVPECRDEILAVYQRIMPAMRAKRDLKKGGLSWDNGEDVSLKSTFVNINGLLAMRHFAANNNAGFDNIFFMKSLRRKLLK